MSGSKLGAEDCRASQKPFVAGEAWQGHLKILCLAALLFVEVLALSLRFEGKTIATGAPQQVGSERPRYACHGSRLDRDPSSVEFQVRRPLGYGTGLRGHRPSGSVSTNPVYEPSCLVVGTDFFAVEIARQCSGHEGIGLVWAVLGACIWFFSRQLRFPQAWLLPPLGGGAPLARELAFRGFFTRWLISAAGWKRRWRGCCSRWRTIGAGRSATPWPLTPQLTLCFRRTSSLPEIGRFFPDRLVAGMSDLRCP